MVFAAWPSRKCGRIPHLISFENGHVTCLSQQNVNKHEKHTEVLLCMCDLDGPPAPLWASTRKTRSRQPTPPKHKERHKLCRSDQMNESPPVDLRAWEGIFVAINHWDVEMFVIHQKLIHDSAHFPYCIFLNLFPDERFPAPITTHIP